ncbi:MAG: transcription antitermination factor NusB [Xanthomonadales bacterium]|nr:transcription antitermination factor NusB [Xanthomonadales bacterium]
MKRPRPDGVDPVARSRARKRALQAIYAWQLGGRAMRDVIEEFAHEQEREFADLEYFHDLLLGIEKHVAELDRELGPYLDRPVDQVDPIERGVLRLAAYELLHRIDVPYRVVLNEAIETTKRFGADHGHTYVNGVLDRACASWREAEFRAARRRQ